MEACSGTHHWAREFSRFGHNVKLMAPKFVAPYLRSLLVMGARSVLAGLGEKQDRFSRWARSLVERRGRYRRQEPAASLGSHEIWGRFPVDRSHRLIDQKSVSRKETERKSPASKWPSTSEALPAAGWTRAGRV